MGLMMKVVHCGMLRHGHVQLLDAPVLEVSGGQHVEGQHGRRNIAGNVDIHDPEPDGRDLDGDKESDDHLVLEPSACHPDRSKVVALLGVVALTTTLGCGGVGNHEWAGQTLTIRLWKRLVRKRVLGRAQFEGQTEAEMGAGHQHPWLQEKTL